MNKYQFQQFFRQAGRNISYYVQKMPKVTRYLLIILLVVFVLEHFFDFSAFALQSFKIGFNPLQLITYAFLHANFSHLFFNALGIWMFGSQIEEYWGEKRYLIFILVCIVGAGLTHMAFQTSGVIGISGLVFGLLLAYGMMWPERKIFLLLPPIPIKAKYMVMGYGALLFFSIFSSSNDGVAHFAHLGGAVSGFLLIQYWRGKPPFNKSKKKSKIYRVK